MNDIQKKQQEREASLSTPRGRFFTYKHSSAVGDSHKEIVRTVLLGRPPPIDFQEMTEMVTARLYCLLLASCFGGPKPGDFTFIIPLHKTAMCYQVLFFDFLFAHLFCSGIRYRMWPMSKSTYGADEMECVCLV